MAREFDGASGAYALGSAAALDNLTEFAVSAWLYPETTGESGTGRIATKRTSDASGGWLFFTDGTMSLGFQTVVASVADANNRGAANSITANTWQHVWVQYSNSGDKLGHIYVNNAEISYATNTAGVLGPGSDADGNLYIGNQAADDRTLDGYLADVAIWNVIPPASTRAALALGYSAAFFRAGRIVFMPLIRDEIDLGGNVVTVTGVRNAQPHPRMIYPALTQTKKWTTAAAAANTKRSYAIFVD